MSGALLGLPRGIEVNRANCQSGEPSGKKLYLPAGALEK